jgi:glycosyltransferase involved in cell wall biosynthesis
MMLPMDERIRLLLTIPSLQGGGAERQFVELVRNLSPDKYVLTVVYFDRPGDHEGPAFQSVISRLGHVSLVYLPREGLFGFAGPLLGLIRLIRARRIQVVHSFLNLASTFGVLAARITGVPHVASAIRDGRDYGFAYKVCRRVQAWGADYLVSNSRAGIDNRFRHWRTNFKVVYNGIDPDRFPPRAVAVETFHQRFKSRHFDALVGMVASLTVAKDHECFLQMAAAVIAQRPGTGFVIVGDGPRRAQIEALSESLGIRNNVVFTGFCPDVDEWAGAFDIACLLSNCRVHDEGLPNAVLEAMACGIPVLATLGGGTPEILRDGIEGFLVPGNDVKIVTDRIICLLDDPQLRYRLGQCGRDFVTDKLSVALCSSQYEAMYRALLLKSGTSRQAVCDS